MNLEFRLLLILLVKTFTRAQFDSNSVMSKLGPQFDLPTVNSSNQVSARWTFSIKSFSDHLDRLFRMKFLKRKRVKRQVRTKRGVLCNKGFKYVYRVSPQGWKYVTEFLANPESAMTKREQRTNHDFLDRALVEYARNVLPDSLKPHAWRICHLLFSATPTRSIDQRFPIQKDLNTIAILSILVKERLALSQKVAELEKNISKMA